MSDAPEQGSKPSSAPLESQGKRVMRLFTHTGIYAAGTFGLQLLSALIVPIYTVLLAPEEYGLWALGSMLLIGLGNLYNPALHGAVTRYFFIHEHDEQARRRFQGTIVSFLLVWGLALTVLLTAFGPWLFDRLFVDLPFHPYGDLITWSCWLATLSVVPNAVWVASERPKTLVMFETLSNAANLLGALALVVLAGIGVLGLFWAKLLSVIVVGLPYIRYLARHVGLRWDGKALRWALVFSLPLVPHLLAHWVLGMADRYIIERYMGLAAVGIYGTAYVFINVVNTVSASLNRALVPIFTRAYEHEHERPFARRILTYFVMAVTAISLVAVALSPTVVRLAYQERYAEAADIAAILAAGGFFQGLYYVYVNGLFFFKRNNIIPVITVVSGGANVALNMLWIPDYGLAGAAWATLVGYLLLTLGVRWGCRRVTKLPFDVPRLARFVSAAILAGVAAILVDGHLPVAAELVVKLALLVAPLAVLHLIGFWSPQELEWAGGHWQKLVARWPRSRR